MPNRASLICAVLLFCLSSPWACKSKGQEAATNKAPVAEPSAAPAPATAAPAPAAAALPSAVVGGWKEIPNSEGFIADVPASAVPNGVGGAAGFHSDDDSFFMTWNETSPEEQAKDLAAVKADAEQFLFVAWVKSETTGDGLLLEWEIAKIDAEGNPSGSQFTFDIRRSAAGRNYTCAGSVATREALDAAEKSCLSVRAR
jgi:hypothetical protein